MVCEYMNKIKVNDFVMAYSKALGLSQNTTNLLNELMEKIILKYEKTIDYIQIGKDETNLYFIKPVDSKYTIEDFFLNRLMRNIWCVEEITQKDIDEGFANPHTKGMFDPTTQTVHFNMGKISKQVENYRKFLGENFETMKNAAMKKVMMHEFLHGLQTKYDSKLDSNYKSVYKRIYDELLKLNKYSSIINSYQSFPNDYARNHYLFTGTHYSDIAIKKGLKTYRNVDGFDNLNEILNESESLEMADQKNYLITKYNEGNYYRITNPESSNVKITNYGYLFKELLGKFDSFEMMYLNPNAGFMKFNERYNDIFQREFNSSKDAIELFIISITKIKETNSIEEHLKLNEVLAKCLQKQLKHFIDNSNISNQMMFDRIAVFEKYLIDNASEVEKSNMKHIQILNQLKKFVNNRQLTTTSTILPIPTLEELQDFVYKYEISSSNDDVIVKERATGNIILDPEITSKVIFSIVWLMSAGVNGKTYESIRGEGYAFNEQAKEIYNYLTNEIIDMLSTTGNIDTIKLFKDVEKFDYKYSQTIISNLFRSEYQINFIENFFRQRCNDPLPKKNNSEVLYNLIYASDLAYGEPDEVTNGKK